MRQQLLPSHCLGFSSQSHSVGSAQKTTTTTTTESSEQDLESQDENGIQRLDADKEESNARTHHIDKYIFIFISTIGFIYFLFYLSFVRAQMRVV